MPESREINLPVRPERKSENGENEKIEKLFKLFVSRTNRQGIHEGKNYLTMIYISLTENERKAMKNRIKESKELEIPGVPKEKITGAKKTLVEEMKNDSLNLSNIYKKIYSEKTSLERKKTLMENQSILEITEKAFEKWQERENKLGKASGKEREAMWIEEKSKAEIEGEKKRITRYIEAGGNPEEVRHLIEAILRREKEEVEIDKKLANMKQGEEWAKKEEKLLGEPVVFVGDVEASTKNLLKSWLTKGLNIEEVEEDVEGTRANVRFAKVIIKELGEEK